MFLFRRVTRSPSHALSPPWMLHSWGASDTLWSPLRAPPDSQGGEWHCDRPCQGISPCQGIPPLSASTERRFFQPGAGRGATVRPKRQWALWASRTFSQIWGTEWNQRFPVPCGWFLLTCCSSSRVFARPCRAQQWCDPGIIPWLCWWARRCGDNSWTRLS